MRSSLARLNAHAGFVFLSFFIPTRAHAQRFELGVGAALPVGPDANYYAQQVFASSARLTLFRPNEWSRVELGGVFLVGSTRRSSGDVMWGVGSNKTFGLSLGVRQQLLRKSAAPYLRAAAGFYGDSESDGLELGFQGALGYSLPGRVRSSIEFGVLAFSCARNGGIRRQCSYLPLTVAVGF